MFQVTYTKNHRMHIDMNSNDSNKDNILIVFKKFEWIGREWPQGTWPT